ncbi:sensor histidine kinase [Aeoliella sp.]|uniref:sensor histidine kinase n=1 Tax=Aeoliella sp. TaxID=2795800 RepID=UPI003CCC057D
MENPMQGGELHSTSDLEQQLQMAKQQLRESQSMAALGELASTTTHEFNNVLTTILNYAKMGLRHTDDATRTKALQKILGAAERANKITNSVLGLARNRSTDPAPTSLQELVDETLVLLERELMKYRVSVERNFAEVPKAMVVGNQIQQVLLNLLTNARQAMPQGGQVILTLAHETSSDFIELTVRDTGSGIPADQLPKIFDQGFSTKKGPDETGKGGAGLGLSACREIIESHGGRIRVASTVGRGTAFTLKLPVASEAATNPTTQPVVTLGA